MANFLQIGEGIGRGEADARQAAMFPTTLAEAGIKLEQAQMTLQTQKKVLDALGHGALDKSQTEDPADQMNRLSQVYLQAGDLDNAEKFAKSASEMANNASLIQEREATRRAKNLGTFTNLLTADTPEAWASANMRYAEEVGEPSPYANVPYQPGMIPQIKASVVTAKDQATIEAAQARSRAADAAAKESKARIPLINAQKKVAEAREKALTKVGVTNSDPKGKDYQAATDKVVEKYGLQLTAEEARDIAGPIAERVVELKATGIGRSAAVKQAFAEAEIAGAFRGLKPVTPHTGSFARPLALPEGFTKTTDPKKRAELVKELQNNKYYILGGRYGNTPRAWDAATKSFKEGKPTAAIEEDDEETETNLDDEGDE